MYFYTGRSNNPKLKMYRHSSSMWTTCNHIALLAVWFFLYRSILISVGNRGYSLVPWIFPARTQESQVSPPLVFSGPVFALSPLPCHPASLCSQLWTTAITLSHGPAAYCRLAVAFTYASPSDSHPKQCRQLSGSEQSAVVNSSP